ncbi:DOMON domain-containing protein [Flavobacterium selenitireducens]|uniref:DOMON domain-containing protein n=1 Tax=Flavobacterium selenitireducens TaxID=2722704 RepID=UPI00168B5FB7|nr:DOMON domain-containing protein [Flavobacterium selenitireducens]MBD3582347.1 T9SS type A sorting domain-containing protein [Flavobacterium selenitireducens]
MKKITLSAIAIMAAATGFAQFSTGQLALSSFGDTSLGMTAKIDVDTQVTLTLTGASADWLGIGFGATGMGDVGADVVIFDGANLTDRSFNGVGVTPPADASQDWNIVSNAVNAGIRTLVATRALNTGDANDYVFTAGAGALTLVYARRSGSQTIGYHGSNSCGSRVAALALSNEEFSEKQVKMYPNPARVEVNFELPEFVNTGEIKLYDAQGRLAKADKITSARPKVTTSGLPIGAYMAVIRTDYGNVTKTLVIE